MIIKTFSHFIVGHENSWTVEQCTTSVFFITVMIIVHVIRLKHENNKFCLFEKIQTNCIDTQTSTINMTSEVIIYI